MAALLVQRTKWPLNTMQYTVTSIKNVLLLDDYSMVKLNKVGDEMSTQYYDCSIHQVWNFKGMYYTEFDKTATNNLI